MYYILHSIFASQPAGSSIPAVTARGLLSRFQYAFTIHHYYPQESISPEYILHSIASVYIAVTKYLGYTPPIHLQSID